MVLESVSAMIAVSIAVVEGWAEAATPARPVIPPCQAAELCRRGFRRTT